jgi:hypothetical protein
VFQVLKRHLTSSPIKVAPEPSGPLLLLYIAATADAVIMGLVAERSEPHQHQEPKAEEAPGSQPPEATPPAPKLCNRNNTVAEFELPEANSGSDNQEATGSQLLGALSNSGG